VILLLRYGGVEEEEDERGCVSLLVFFLVRMGNPTPWKCSFVSFLWRCMKREFNTPSLLRKSWTSTPTQNKRWILAQEVLDLGFFHSILGFNIQFSNFNSFEFPHILAL